MWFCIYAKNCTQTPTSHNSVQLSKTAAEVSTYSSVGGSGRAHEEPKLLMLMKCSGSVMCKDQSDFWSEQQLSHAVLCNCYRQNKMIFSGWHKAILLLFYIHDFPEYFAYHSTQPSTPPGASSPGSWRSYRLPEYQRPYPGLFY